MSLFKLTIPILAIVIIAIQLTIINQHQLSRWRGGGFGMYAEVHPNEFQVWVNPSSIPFDDLVQSYPELKTAVNKTKIYPSVSNMRFTAKLLSQLSKSDSLKISVWKPLISSKDQNYTRKLVADFEYIKPTF